MLQYPSRIMKFSPRAAELTTLLESRISNWEAKEVRQVQVKLTIAFWQAISTKKHSSVTTINLLREERSDCRLDSRYASFLILLNFPDWLSVTSIN